jgi:hypothetical protein
MTTPPSSGASAVVTTRSEREHHIRWEDGVEAVVTGEWTDAWLIAQARESSSRLREAADRAVVMAQDLRLAADEACRFARDANDITATLARGSIVLKEHRR